MAIGLGVANGWGMPVSIGLDYGIHRDITVGAEFSLVLRRI